MNISQATLKNADSGQSYRYESLEHWRGIAALAVVFRHGFYPMTVTDQVLHPVVRFFVFLSEYGGYGVIIFFVLSGYCISVKGVATLKKNETARHFAVDRVLRIFPTYWAACLFAILVAVMASPFSAGKLVASLPAGPLGLLGDVFLIHPYLNVPPVLGVSWTLVYEVGFYLMTAAGLSLAARCKRLDLVVVAGGILAVVGVVGMGNFRVFYLLNHWPDFYCGVAVFLFVHFSLERPVFAALSCLIPCALGILAVSLHGWEGAASFLVAVVFSLVLMALKSFDRNVCAVRFLGPVALCGTFSYTLYLIHQPLTTRIVNGGLRFFRPDTLWALVPVGVAVVVALGASWIFYRQIELRVENWRRKWARQSACSRKQVN